MFADSAFYATQRPQGETIAVKDIVGGRRWGKGNCSNDFAPHCSNAMLAAGFLSSMLDELSGFQCPFRVPYRIKVNTVCKLGCV